MPLSAPHLPGSQTVERLRRFSEAHRRHLAPLMEPPRSDSLTPSQARTLLALADQGASSASGLARRLAVDPSQGSRTLAELEGRGLVARERSPVDGRVTLSGLTPAGRDLANALREDMASRLQSFISGLPAASRVRLLEGAAMVEDALEPASRQEAPWLLRPHGSGDLGWIVHRHGVLYAEAFGWKQEFEGFVAGIVADFARGCDPERERCWIAERAGENVGSVLLTRHPDQTGVGRLRLLLVEPRARGLGIGARLVAECTRFAREAGYRSLELWTTPVLKAAAQLYRKAGCRRVSGPTREEGPLPLAGDLWELDLAR